MANIPTLKGVRTRFRNILDKEITNATAICSSEIIDSERNIRLQEARKCLKVIKLYIGKLQEQTRTLSDAVGDKDLEFIERITEEDCDLIFKADSTGIDLEEFILCQEKVKDIERKETTQSVYEMQMLEMQGQIQKMLDYQLRQMKEKRERKEEKEKHISTAIKLPKIDLITFNGDKMQWAAFWDSFECTVHNNSKLSNIEKFNYLLSKIRGDAQSAVAGLSLSNENYEKAVKTLKERFGNKQEAINLHYSELINIPSPTYKVQHLRTFLDTIEKNLRSLEVLRENVNQNVFVSIISSKLPAGVLKQLELKKGANVEWTVELLRHEMYEYISACEKAEKVNQDGKPKTQHEKTKPQFQTSNTNRIAGSAEALFSTTNSESHNTTTQNVDFAVKHTGVMNA